jgi:DNA-binding response OmpR family regulator
MVWGGEFINKLRMAEKDSFMSEQFKDKTVLIVDDDPDVLATIAAALTPTGAKVLTASDGNTAVELAEKEQPDLIVLDMMLPKRSGFLVVERIKARKPKGSKPFVIMITGNMGTRHKTYAETLGVDDYINKPFRIDRLLGSMDKLLNAPPAAQ